MNNVSKPEIRKQVGQFKKDSALKRLYELNQFVVSLKKKSIHEPNIKPIRKTVGRLKSTET